MSQFCRIGVTLFAVAILVNPAAASGVYWTEVPWTPQYIVLGTMIEVSASVYEGMGWDWEGVGHLIQIFDTGIVEVEEVLFGKNVPERLPVSWMARIRVAPPNDDKNVHSGNESEYAVGDRRIWVLWRKSGDASTPQGHYHGFQALSIETRERVISEIEEIVKK